MKRLTVALIILSLLCCLSSCAIPAETGSVYAEENHQTTIASTSLNESTLNPIETEQYTIYWENGKCYLKSYVVDKGDSDSNTGINAMSYYVSYPHFSSLAEMKLRLTTGALSEDELYALTFRQEDKSTGIEIMDIDHLYEAAFPSDLTVDYIEFSGKGYRYCFKELTGSIACFDEESYHYNFESVYQNPSGVRTLISQEIDQENKTITYSQNNDGKVYKTVTYSTIANSIPIHVSELYLVNNTDEAESETLTMLYIFGVKETQHFMVSFIHLEDADTEHNISEEWISSFGLREYVETEVS